MITSYTLDEIVKGLPNYRVSEKQTQLLRALEHRSKHAGAKVGLTPAYDYSLAWCSTAEELHYLLRALVGRGLVEQHEHRNSAPPTFTITPSGWSLLDETAPKRAVASSQAFVAMSFSSELLSAWKHGIEPAVAAAGYRPYRVDAQPHIDRIDNKIVSEIKESRFLIADVTLQRPGVYFEAGLALGLGLPVFWSVREDDLENVHFDTRQYNHIVWRTEEQLNDRLYEFICAVLGRRGAT